MLIGLKTEMIWEKIRNERKLGNKQAKLNKKSSG